MQVDKKRCFACKKNELCCSEVNNPASVEDKLISFSFYYKNFVLPLLRYTQLFLSSPAFLKLIFTKILVQCFMFVQYKWFVFTTHFLIFLFLLLFFLDLFILLLINPYLSFLVLNIVWNIWRYIFLVILRLYWSFGMLSPCLHNADQVFLFLVFFMFILSNRSV